MYMYPLSFMYGIFTYIYDKESHQMQVNIPYMDPMGMV